MDDDRLWGFEQSLWIDGPDNYRDKVDGEVVMVLPRPPFLFTGEAAVAAVADTPTWDRATLSDRSASRPQEGWIVVGYRVHAEKDGHGDYEAWCTSTIRRIAHDVWRVVQHQQLPTPNRQE